VPVGSNPESATYDAATDQTFVANSGSDNVSVINDRSNRVVATVAVGNGPQATTYDPVADEVIVGNGGSNDVSVINGTTDLVAGTVPTGNHPIAAVYDAGTGAVDIANYGEGTVSELEFPTTYAVTFTETGLPVGTAWSVTLNGTWASSNTTEIAFAEPNGTYAYSIAPIPGFTTTAPAGSAMVRGSPISVPVLWTVSVYTITFTEKGLPAGSLWWVNVSGGRSGSATSNAVTVAEPNGSYTYTVTTVAGSFLAPGGGFAVDGAPLGESVTFLREYRVTLTESGLPAGTQWQVVLTGGGPFVSTNSTITLSEPNGSYDYGASSTNQEYSAARGSFEVEGGDAFPVVPFALVTFPVTFTEAGLSTGSNWSVVVNGLKETSVTTQLSFAEPNGTFSYAVGAPDGWLVTGESGSPDVGTVIGSAVSITVAFSEITYVVQFNETGLGTGTVWSVTFDSTTQNSSTDLITFLTPNGTYPYTVAGVSDYRSIPSSGSVTVNGSGRVQAISFAHVTTGTSPSPLTSWQWVVVGAVAILLVVVAVRVYRRARPPVALPGEPPLAPHAGEPPR
ncbi:MAG: YncE family protein, partial [Candidatus Acidiferrales bacterium]